jgi:ornithine carbamoyltransferase
MPLVSPSITRLISPGFTRDLDITSIELVHVLDLAREVKRAPAQFRDALAGRSVALLFEKPSLRTRLTFDLGIQQMGGITILSEGPLGSREPVKDVARNLSRWVDGIVARTFRQDTIDELAQWAGIPVVNALSNAWHPCQALADMQTLIEHFGQTQGLKLAYIGDGNNVSNSLMLCAARLGIDVAIGGPERYRPDAQIVAEARALGGKVTVTDDPFAAVAGANAVYTDVWTSMGNEHESEERLMAFAAYQVNQKLFEAALPDAIFMHCLPAHRGEEVTDEVIESPRSAVLDQAENRLHAQKALLLMLLSK